MVSLDLIPTDTGLYFIGIVLVDNSSQKNTIFVRISAHAPISAHAGCFCKNDTV